MSLIQKEFPCVFPQYLYKKSLVLHQCLFILLIYQIIKCNVMHMMNIDIIFLDNEYLKSQFYLIHQIFAIPCRQEGGEGGEEAKYRFYFKAHRILRY